MIRVGRNRSRSAIPSILSISPSALVARSYASGYRPSISVKTLLGRKQLMERIAENYGKIRNTFRYVLAILMVLIRRVRGLRSKKCSLWTSTCCCVPRSSREGSARLKIWSRCSSTAYITDSISFASST